MKRKTSKRWAIAAVIFPIGSALVAQALFFVGIYVIGIESMEEMMRSAQAMLQFLLGSLLLLEVALGIGAFLFLFNAAWVSLRRIAPLQYDKAISVFPALFWDELVEDYKTKA
ncbi:hypothetical protein [Mycoplana dimorpha]|uniref:Uncharacterized protein n=1 Tax=Mycoplana dimorpha TaxID=28320 RepID=A0A2T5BIW2_MYCDI|nr:hypothetical protein [Mycoplana dimorpha]PTM98925.1 hypothetical protein C7449_101591 [Mycoplana dimorpha]